MPVIRPAPGSTITTRGSRATEADLRNDVTRWVYNNGFVTSFGVPSGWGHEVENSSLGALMALRA